VRVEGGAIDGFFVAMFYWCDGRRWEHLEENEADEVGTPGEDAEEQNEMRDIKLAIREAEE
jgi:hypothetical protein